MCFISQGLAVSNRYDDKHLMSNEVPDKTQSPLKTMYNVQSLSRNTDCPSSSKPAMANRLLDWFSVVMVDSKHRRQHPKPKGKRKFIAQYLSAFKCRLLASRKYARRVCRVVEYNIFCNHYILFHKFHINSYSQKNFNSILNLISYLLVYSFNILGLKFFAF